MHLVAGHGFTSTQKEEKRVSIHSGLLRQSISDSSPTQARIHSSFRKRIHQCHRTKHSLMKEYFRSERRRLLNSISLIIQLIFCIAAHRVSSGSRTISCTSAIIPGFTTTQQVTSCVNTENNSYTRVTQSQWLMDKQDLTKAVFDEQQANFAGVTHRTLKGLPPSIDPDRPPRNYKDAMSREDRQEWGEAFTKEYRGFVERGAFKAVRPRPGVKVHDTR